MEEIWEIIKEVDNKYEISNLGNIRNYKTKKVLKQNINKKGYFRITLLGKSYLTHKLVALYFIPNAKNKKYVIHKNNNKLDNNVDNLEWSNKNNWDEEQLNELKKEYSKDNVDLENLSERIGKTKEQIKSTAFRYKLSSNNYFKEEEIKYLKENEKCKTLKEIAKELNRDYSTVSSQYKKMGIRKEPVIKNSWDMLSKKKRKSIILKRRETRIKNCTLNPNKNTNNPYSRAKGGKRKDLDNIYFRSSWEANMARYYNFIGVKWEFEPKTFVFKDIRRGSVSYTPDFYLPEEDRWIEVKGWMDGKSKTKLKRFKNQYPEEYKKLTLITEKEYKEIERKMKYFIKNWE